MRRFAHAAWPPLAVFLGSMIAAELAVRLLGVPAWLLPPPSVVGAAILEQRQELSWALFCTARASALGFVLSALAGVVLAVALSTSRLVRRAFYPYTVFFQTVPVVAIAPLLILWFGFGNRTVVASVFIVSVFPVIANTLTGLLSTDPALRDLFRLHGAGRLATLWKLSLPSAMPNILTGLRIASGLAVIGAIVGEMFAGSLDDKGLGVLLMESRRHLETPVVFAVVLASSLLGLLLFGTVNLAGSLLLRRWHVSEQGP